MALFSDIDWIIIAGVATFLLFGRESRGTLRMLGRWYGRAMRVKQELLSEFSKAAELPPPPAGQPWSMRAALFEVGGDVRRDRGVPVAVGSAPGLPASPVTASGMGPAVAWTGGTPTASWSTSASCLPAGWREVP
jgi:hypothetical protein